MVLLNYVLVVAIEEQFAFTVTFYSGTTIKCLPKYSTSRMGIATEYFVWETVATLLGSPAIYNAAIIYKGGPVK